MNSPLLAPLYYSGALGVARVWSPIHSNPSAWTLLWLFLTVNSSPQSTHPSQLVASSVEKWCCGATSISDGFFLSLEVAAISAKCTFWSPPTLTWVQFLQIAGKSRRVVKENLNGLQLGCNATLALLVLNPLSALSTNLYSAAFKCYKKCIRLEV